MWKDTVYRLVVDYCNEIGWRTFTLQEFFLWADPVLETAFPRNRHRPEKVRQTLQFLRADGLLTFVDNRGTYTLRGMDLLQNEVDQPEVVRALPFTGREKEYLLEIRARDRGWVRLARQTYGEYCLVPDCSNTFVKEDGSRYVEVHHIVPLCEGGEEQIWNLCVLCAHHHRMAHYAREGDRNCVQAALLEQTQHILTTPSRVLI